MKISELLIDRMTKWLSTKVEDCKNVKYYSDEAYNSGCSCCGSVERIVTITYTTKRNGIRIYEYVGSLDDLIHTLDSEDL